MLLGDVPQPIEAAGDLFAFVADKGDVALQAAVSEGCESMDEHGVAAFHVDTAAAPDLFFCLAFDGGGLAVTGDIVGDRDGVQVACEDHAAR